MFRIEKKISEDEMNELKKNMHLKRLVQFSFDKGCDVKKLTKYIDDNPKCIYHLLSILPLAILLEIERDYGIFTRLCNKELFDHAARQNIIRIQIALLNNTDIDNEIIEISETKYKFSDFTSETIQKRVDYLQKKMNKIDFNDFNFTTNVIHYLTDNYLFKKIEAGTKETIVLCMVPNTDEIKINKNGNGLVYSIPTKNSYMYCYENIIILIPLVRCENSAMILHSGEENMFSIGIDAIYCTLKEYNDLENHPTLTNYDDIISHVKVVHDSRRILVDQEMQLLSSDKYFNKCIRCDKYYDKHSVINNYKNFCLECSCCCMYYEKFSCNLKGKHALVTGARTGLGYNVTLKLLRCGAYVIGTSRFAYITWYKYSRELDFDEWKHRLTIYSCNYLIDKQVKQLVAYILKDRLDIFINNACLIYKLYPVNIAKIVKLNSFIEFIDSKNTSELMCLNMDIIKDKTISSNFSVRPIKFIDFNQKATTLIEQKITMLEYDFDSYDYRKEYANITNNIIDNVNYKTPRKILEMIEEVILNPVVIINVLTFISKNRTNMGLNKLHRAVVKECTDENMFIYGVDPDCIDFSKEKNRKIDYDIGTASIFYPILLYYNNRKKDSKTLFRYFDTYDTPKLDFIAAEA